MTTSAATTTKGGEGERWEQGKGSGETHQPD